MKITKYVLAIALLVGGMNALADQFYYRICMSAPSEFKAKLPLAFTFSIATRDYVESWGLQSQTIEIKSVGQRYCTAAVPESPQQAADKNTQTFVWNTTEVSCGGHRIENQDAWIDFKVFKNKQGALEPILPGEHQYLRTSTNRTHRNEPTLYVQGSLFGNSSIPGVSSTTKINETTLTETPLATGEAGSTIELPNVSCHFLMKCNCNPKHNYDIDFTLTNKWIV
jgi:hypothetical protein